MDRLAVLCDSLKPDLIVGIEARGFIVGMGLATHKKLGFVPVRKPGKLPGKVYGIDYALEYGTDRLEIHADAMKDQPRILIVDDLLATGGTASATADLVKQAGGHVVGCPYIVELTAFEGRKRLPETIQIDSLLHYS
jgi:adenine phosphoribosyltransferase